MNRMIVDVPRINKLIAYMRDLDPGLYEVRISKYDRRNLDQNALSHVWYKEISETLKQDTPDEVKAECKLRFGVPILRSEDDDFRALYDHCMKHTLTYEQKLKAMYYLPVTSLFTWEQMNRYLSQIQAHYEKEHGMMLESVTP